MCEKGNLNQMQRHRDGEFFIAYFSGQRERWGPVNALVRQGGEGGLYP